MFLSLSFILLIFSINNGYFTGFRMVYSSSMTIAKQHSLTNCVAAFNRGWVCRYFPLLLSLLSSPPSPPSVLRLLFLIFFVIHVGYLSSKTKKCVSDIFILSCHFFALSVLSFVLALCLRLSLSLLSLTHSLSHSLSYSDPVPVITITHSIFHGNNLDGEKIQ